ncbi:hypothetical protein ACVFYP_25025 [Roseomonas sp. F4]
MPFEPPWADFRRRDLVYGVEEAPLPHWCRRRYLDDPHLFLGGLTIEDFHIMQGEANANRRGQAHFKLMLQTHKFGSSVDAPITNEAARRKDKGGLLWAAQIGRTVHFVLDGLDMAAVVNKNFVGANPDREATAFGPKNRAVTGSELRWLYRNRYMPQVKKVVQFWFRGVQVPPPWVAYYELGHDDEGTVLVIPHAGAALWAQYHPHLVPVPG